MNNNQSARQNRNIICLMAKNKNCDVGPIVKGYYYYYYCKTDYPNHLQTTVKSDRFLNLNLTLKTL